MALDDLKETIETLRERIQTHRAYLEGYERRTRQALIDPMLRALGWDVENPDSIQIEYRNNQDWLDYVLIGSEGPIAVIEAKKLKAPLHDKATDQAIIYAHRADIPYMIVTDGDHWQMAPVFERGRLEDRILMDFQLTRDEPYACVLQALGIWRPNLASGKPQEAATPVMIEKPARAESEPTVSEPSSEQEAVESSNNGDWEPLTSWKKIRKTQKPPANTNIKLPDLSTRPINHWIDIWVSVANYLIETGKISAKDCPIRKKEDAKTYLLHTEPRDRDGEKFRQKKEIGGLWLFTNFNPPSAQKNSCWLLENFGVNPSTVLVSTNRS